MPLVYWGTGWFIGIAFASALRLPPEFLLLAFLVPIVGLFLWRRERRERLIWISVIFAICGGIWFTVRSPRFDQNSLSTYNISAVNTPPQGFDFLSGVNSTEGFLFPDSYIFSRQITADELVNELVRNFSLRLPRDLRLAYENQGLTVYQAVTLASIVQREAIHEEEAPIIASVYINRLNISMRLEADPTVQYAIGYNSAQGKWWTNPLSASDLEFDSPFNTYVYAGLPPAPISNPGLNALQAVAFPTETPYYFFRAKCDGSGYHSFAVTFEEHLGNGCQ